MHKHEKKKNTHKHYFISLCRKVYCFHFMWCVHKHINRMYFRLTCECLYNSHTMSYNKRKDYHEKSEWKCEHNIPIHKTINSNYSNRIEMQASIEFVRFKWGVIFTCINVKMFQSRGFQWFLTKRKYWNILLELDRWL